MLLKLEELSYLWSNYYFESPCPERKEAIINLVGEPKDFDSLKYFQYELPSHIHQSYLIDTYELILFSNGICFLYIDLGNVDHSFIDHRVGLYEETLEEIKIRTIKIDKLSEDHDVNELVFQKKSDDTLFLDDKRDKAVIKEKILTLKKFDQQALNSS